MYYRSDGMSPLNDLKRELANYESELASIT